MIGESPAVNPELSDIRRIKEIGIPTFLNEQENAEEGLYVSVVPTTVPGSMSTMRHSLKMRLKL